MSYPTYESTGYGAPMNVGTVAHVVEYTREGFREVNKELRSGVVSPTAQLIDEELTLIPFHLGGATYRGMKLSRFLETVRDGVFCDPGYLSTSKRLMIAQDFGNYGENGGVILEIHGWSGVDLNFHPEMESEEQEVLYPRNSRFRVEQLSEVPKIYRLVEEGMGFLYPTEEEGEWGL